MSSSNNHERLSDYAERVPNYIATRALPAKDSQETQALLNATLARFPRPKTATPGPADKKARQTNILAVARWSSLRPNQVETEQQLKVRAEMAIRDAWTAITRGGTLPESLDRLIWRFKIGSAVAGLGADGRHNVWDEEVTQVLPEMACLMSSQNEHDRLGEYAEKVSTWLATRPLPAKGSPQMTTFLEATLARFPKPTSLEEWGEITVTTITHFHQRARLGHPVSLVSDPSIAQDSDVAVPGPSNPPDFKKAGRTNILAVAKWSFSRPKQEETEEQLRIRADMAVRDAWTTITRGGTLRESLDRLTWRFKVGSAVTRLGANGRHNLWDQEITELLPNMDCLVVIATASMVSKPTSPEDKAIPFKVIAGTMPHLSPRRHVAQALLNLLFVFDFGFLFVLSLSELISHLNGPSVFFAQQRVPSEHPFVAFAEGEARRRLYSVGQGVDMEQRRYEALLSTPSTSTFFLTASQDEMITPPAVTSDTARCPICDRLLQCSSAWQLACHIYDSHRRQHPLPWGDYAMKAEMANILAWLNDELKRRKSPLALPNHRREYEARTSRTVVNNSEAALSAVLKKGNKAQKGPGKGKKTLSLVQSGVKCPSYDSKCPATDAEETWTHALIAAHVKRYHPTDKLCRQPPSL
ncbi:unnamed protein product [Parajaminaea phylloscopi]